jgi:hypothetical protein
VEPEPHHFDGAGTVIRCGSGSNKNFFNVSGLLNMSQSVQFIFVTILIMQKSEKTIAPTLRLTLVCFQKVALVYRRSGAGAASKFLLIAGAN